MPVLAVYGVLGLQKLPVSAWATFIRYTVIELELLAVVRAVRKCGLLLSGIGLQFVTPYKSYTWYAIFAPYSCIRFLCVYMIDLLLKCFLVCQSPMFETWKVPKRPVEVTSDVMQRLVAYGTAVETWTNNSGMCANMPDNTHGCPACIH